MGLAWEHSGVVGGQADSFASLLVFLLLTQIGTIESYCSHDGNAFK